MRLSIGILQKVVSVTVCLFTLSAIEMLAQTKWASEGQVVHGHHHLNVSDRAAHEHFWGQTLGGIPTPWRDVNIFKFRTSTFSKFSNHLDIF